MPPPPPPAATQKIMHTRSHPPTHPRPTLYSPCRRRLPNAGLVGTIPSNDAGGWTLPPKLNSLILTGNNLGGANIPSVPANVVWPTGLQVGVQAFWFWVHVVCGGGSLCMQ